ncbi:MAG: hypothetical protein QW548_00440 [Candidatus Aenigmatarchaeota archaeon]
MQLASIIEYYSNEKIAKAITEAAVGREAVGVYASGHYDSRPNVIQFPADVGQLARKGITSFHISVERWRFPMQLAAAGSANTNSSSALQTRYDTLRTGWDFVIDIDSKLGLGESTVAAQLICKLFQKYGIKRYGLKFSGRRGWHICLPWNAFPKTIDYKPAEVGYPRIARILARFIRSKIAAPLMDELLKRRPLKEMLEVLDVMPSELSPFYFVEIEQDWGARHLVRAPYSLNEKTWNVSLPIAPDQLATFSPEVAKADVVLKAKEVQPFFVAEPGSAEGLLLDALDWWAVQKKEEQPAVRREVRLEGKVSEADFPPCIRNILAGLKDGKKRSGFTLISFLRFANWSWHEIEGKLQEWNVKNSPQLPQSVLLSQLRWAMQQNRSINPANCSNDLFYKSIGICQPDGFCKNRAGEVTIKNPISYPFRKLGIGRKSNSWAMKQQNRPTHGLPANAEGTSCAANVSAASPARYDKMKVKSNYVMRGFSCDECAREFKTLRALAAHKTRMHGG